MVGSTLKRYRPDPLRLWVECMPGGWPAAEGWWADLTTRSLGRARSGALGPVEPSQVSGPLYVPPVNPRQESELEDFLAPLRQAGGPLVVQRRPGDAATTEGDFLDLTPWLLLSDSELEEALPAPRCRCAIWPLVTGVSDGSEGWAALLPRLAEAGFEQVLPVTLNLQPAERRLIAESAAEDRYHQIFHGAAPDERAIARRIAGLGMVPWAIRPAADESSRRAFRRRVAGELVLAAEYWLRLGRSEAAGQDLLRAARWCEDTDHDLEAMTREGNAEIVPWLDENSRAVLEDLALGRPCSLRTALEAEYLAAGDR